MKNLKFILLLATTLLFSCSSDDGPDLIEFETLAVGEQSPVNPGRSEHVINDESAYEALFGTTVDADFDRETVIAVFLGPVGNDNNTFRIEEIVDNVSNITVRITWRSPRVLSGSNTNHYHVVKTRKLSRTINFSTTEIRE